VRSRAKFIQFSLHLHSANNQLLFASQANLGSQGNKLHFILGYVLKKGKSF
jgi:hypothetical protein